MAVSDVIVVGAGPVGLTVAAQAVMLGARVRVVERRPGPRQWAPALAIHPRTMEIMRGLGVADSLLARGLTQVDLRIHIDGKTAEGSLGALSLPVTEFPFISFVPQPLVEAVLVERLSELGVDVEWDTGVVAVHQTETGAEARVITPDGGDGVVAGRFLVGCDGADSTVREAVGIPFRGRTYRQSILVADAATDDLEPGTAHAFLSGRGILFFFPLPTGRWRLIAPARHHEESDDALAVVERHTNGQVDVRDLGWARVVRPRHRLARSYRNGRVFLAGDAAHVHSPAAAQGMNTGIQDAANLGWKLAFVANCAGDALLDSYETERRPVARHVVRLTGLAFALEVSDFIPLRWARRWTARPIADLLLTHHDLLSMVARLVSGLDTSYPKGAMGIGSALPRRFRPGRRFPDAEIAGQAGSRLHDVIDATAFHLVVFDDTVQEASLDGLRERLRDTLRIHRLDGSLFKGGRLRVSYVLVRPDGYIAASGTDVQLGSVEELLTSWLGDQSAAARSTL